MAFTANLPEAARRHLSAADMLCNDPGHRTDVAGYLYGIAAECAIKQMVIRVVLPPQYDKEAILFSHFPELRTRLRDVLSGRNAKVLSSLIYDDSFMNNWSIKMRYADARQIPEAWVFAWQKQARRAVNAMET